MTDKTMTLEQVRYEISALNAGGSYIPHGSLSKWAEAIDRHLSQPAERGEAVKKAEPVDRQHCQCPSCVDGIIHDAGCAVHNEPAMKIGPCDCSKRKSIDAAIFVGNTEPRAWISTVMCRGPDYGKERYDRLPIQSLNPLYYKHTPLYTAPPPAAGVPDELVRMTIRALDDVDTEMRATGRATNRFSQLASDWRGMLSATPSPTIDVEAVRELIKDWRVMARITGNKYERESLAMCADKLARAIGDAK